MKKETNIDVTLNKKEDYQNKFNENTLSTELSNYLYEECQGTPLANSIHLTIYLKCKVTKKERENLKEKIQQNYANAVKEEQLLESHAKLFRTVLFLLGVLFLSMSYFIENLHVHIASEVIDVIAWVAIWEAVYNYFFESTRKQVRIKRYKKLSNCTITFKED